VDNGDGTYAISGQKIYITWGDHDCADNIIHLVLARLPDAPEGSRGISLFICPKVFVDDDGNLGERNAFKPIGLEHKLGIHGSPTCVMEFNGATGWLVGEENRGLSCMFTMMNEARLFVGVQGVAIPPPLFEQARGQTLLAVHASDDDTRKAAHIREALLTPLAKSYGSDVGVDVSSIGVQIHGGMGFVEETGAAQHYRDSRIAPIYEGTNGIQAMDLVGRKLRRDGGEGMRAVIADLDAILELAQGSKIDLSVCTHALINGIETVKNATDIILNADEGDALAGATPYLNLVANVISGAYIIRAVANGALAGDELTENMASLARYHALSIMPQAQGQLDFLRGGQKAVFDFPVEQLADL